MKVFGTVVANLILIHDHAISVYVRTWLEYWTKCRRTLPIRHSSEYVKIQTSVELVHRTLMRCASRTGESLDFLDFRHREHEFVPVGQNTVTLSIRNGRQNAEYDILSSECLTPSI